MSSPNGESEIIWLDGDIMESWDELLEHLWVLGELKGEDGYYVWRGGRFTKDALVSLLKEIVSLNVRLYDAWALLLKVRRGGDVKPEIEEYLADTLGYVERKMPDA